LSLLLQKKTEEKYDEELSSNVKPIPPGFTIWDKVIIDQGDFTVHEFLKVFPEVHYGCTIHTLFFKVVKKTEDKTYPVWVKNPINPQQREAKVQNEKRKLTEIFVEQYGALHPSRKYILLEATVRGPDGDDVIVPLIQYNFK